MKADILRAIAYINFVLAEEKLWDSERDSLNESRRILERLLKTKS